MDDARLIIDRAFPGSQNMAVDQALLMSAAETGLPVLRFYEWSPPTLSLGYFQSVADRQLHPSSARCDLVRRATGGGAILHDLELTYSLCMPIGDKSAGGAHSLYSIVHQSLIDVLGQWGIAAALYRDEPGREGHSPFLCFQRRSPGDVVLDAFKICGSAQRRFQRAILQHGSILLARSANAPELPGIYEIVGVKVPILELRRLLADGLERRLGFRFVPANLTQNEELKAREIMRTRFGHHDWTNRR